MVLELPKPQGGTWEGLGRDLPVLHASVLGFVPLGIHWNDHDRRDGFPAAPAEAHGAVPALDGVAYAVLLTLVSPYLGIAVSVVVARMRLVPDPRVERRFEQERSFVEEPPRGRLRAPPRRPAARRPRRGRTGRTG